MRESITDLVALADCAIARQFDAFRMTEGSLV
jgi:hypothetical protein